MFHVKQSAFVGCNVNVNSSCGERSGFSAENPPQGELHILSPQNGGAASQTSQNVWLACLAASVVGLFVLVCTACNTRAIIP